jgi:hypothetical protein
MSKFVWVTNSYRINIDSIFSLQRVKVSDNPAYKKWENDYIQISTDIVPDDATVVEIDSEKYTMSDINNDDKLLDKFHKILDAQIIEKIGNEPDPYLYEYYCITCDGVKIQLNKGKYDLINDIIDKYCS